MRVSKFYVSTLKEAPAEADIAKGLISLESPLGSALMNREVGETVTFATPGGPRSATVVEVG